MGSVEVDELKHDREGTEWLKRIEPFLESAMDELIDRLFSGKKVGRFYLDAYVERYAMEISAKIITNDWVGLRNGLEGCIRDELADSDEVRELAAEFAQEKLDE